MFRNYTEKNDNMIEEIKDEKNIVRYKTNNNKHKFKNKRKKIKKMYLKHEQRKW